MQFAKWLPALIWVIVILSFSNDGFSSDNTEGWLELIAARDVAPAANNILRKGGHVAGYAVLALLAWLADRRILRPLLLALLVAVVDETKQSFTVLREGSPWDVVLDTSSAALALLVLEKLRYLRSRGVKP